MLLLGGLGLAKEVKSLLAPRDLETSSYNLAVVELGNYLCLCDSNNTEYIDIWRIKVSSIGIGKSTLELEASKVGELFMSD